MAVLRVGLTIDMLVQDASDVSRIAVALRDLLADRTGSPGRLAAASEMGSLARASDVGPVKWTARDFEELWDELSSGDRIVLRAMSTKPEGMTEHELLEELEGKLVDGKLDMATVEGHLAAIHQHGSQIGNHEPVYRRNPQTGAFELEFGVSGFAMMMAHVTPLEEGGAKTSMRTGNKSEEMRRLAMEGHSTSEIAKRLGVRYQFVYNVLSAARLLK